MNKRAVKYILFFVLLIFVDRITGTVISHLAKKQTADNRIGKLIDGEIPADIYIVGSSRALNNYSPPVISQRTGRSTYNIGVSGSNILFHETIIDLILLQEKKPSMIIYNLDDYGTLYKMDGIIYRKDVLYPYVDHPYINQQVSRYTSKNEIATLISDSYRQNVNFINAIKYLVYGREVADYKTTNFDQYGSNLLLQRAEDPIPPFNARKNYIRNLSSDAENEAAFMRIQQKCLSNNITLVLSLPPLFTDATEKFNELIAAKKLDGVHLLDFTGKMQEAKYFFNGDHMNNNGAAIFSEMVSDELVKINK